MTNKTNNGFASRLRSKVLETHKTTLRYATPVDQLVATPPKTLDKLEKDIDAPLPPLVRALYADARELGIAWKEGGETAVAAGKRVKWNELGDQDSLFWSEHRGEPGRGGIINILPAAEVFQKGYWIDRIVPEPQDEDIEVDGRTILDSAFYADLYPFDFVNGYHIVGLWYDRERSEWRVVLGDDHGACWTDYQTMSVEDYFAQLTEGLGGPRTFVDVSRSESRTTWAIEAPRGRAGYPSSDRERPEIPSLERIRILAESSPVSDAVLDASLAAHARFVENAEEATWDLLCVEEIPISIYGDAAEDAETASEPLNALAATSAMLDGLTADDPARAREIVQAIEQAIRPLQKHEGQLVLRLKRVAPGTILEGRSLAAADLSGTICEGVRFANAVLDRSIATDSFFDGADFSGASLVGVDFTRSSLRDCNFRGANVSGTDFENTDLTGADFTDVELDGARFPGAILDGVRP